MTTPNELFFLDNGGETGSLIQAFNWATTPLGPIDTWPQSLKVALQILLSSRFPMQILWGPEYIQFYNDAYIPIAGDKHPAGIGQRGADCWAEVWEFAGARLDRVMATGEATWSEDQPLVLHRNGEPDEGYFTFSYTPVWETPDRVGGVFIAVNETTQKVVGKRLEQALQISQDQLDSILNTAPASIARFRFFSDRTYKLDYRSVGCETLTGYPLAALTAELWAERTFAEDYAAILAPMFDAAFEQRPITVEYRFRHRDGSIRWIADSLTSRRDEANDCWVVTMVGIDITTRKEAEEALRSSEAHLAMAQRVAQFGSWEFYPDSQRSLWSKAMFTQFGYDPAQTEPSYAELMERIHPDDRTMVEGFFQRAIADHHAYTFDLRVVLPDGTIRYLNFRCQAVLDAQGQVVKLMGTCLDITNRKQIEMVLQESRARLQLALEGADCGTWDYDLISQALVWSDRCKAMFGIAPETEMSFERFAQAIHPDDRDRVQQGVEAAIAHRQDYDVQMRTRWPDGTQRWVRSIGRVYDNDLGQPYRMAGVVFDISTLKQAELALQESEDRYRVLAEAMPQMVWLADRSGVQYWNQRWYDYTGLPRGNALGVEGTNVVHPDEQACTLDLWQQAIDQGAGFDIEQRIRRHDGVYRWFLNRGLPVQDASGKVTRWVGTITDIDDQKQLETQRARLLDQERIARESAENANRIKDEFLAVLSHELRSPLNPILGWAKLLRTTQLNEAKTEYALETIERNARLQSQLIDDLLDVSRILRGKLVLNQVPTAPAAVIRDAIETVQSMADAKDIALQTELDESPYRVLGDPNRLRQVVWNLLSNAVKFTPQGGKVTVRLSYADTRAEIRVSDTGKGIDPDFLPHVFDHFRQADSTTTRDFGGLGLGLAIADQLVEMHQGTLTAASPGAGQGATFTVRLPVTIPTDDTPSPISPLPRSTSLQNIHVMIVEDDVDSRNVITTTLQEFGAQVTALPAAADALTALAQIKPDILVSDIGMPDMDGYRLIQQIREMTQTSQIPAIALTAYTTAADQQKSLLAGFQKHLSKPMEVAQLIEAIAALVNKSPPS